MGGWGAGKLNGARRWTKPAARALSVTGRSRGVVADSGRGERAATSPAGIAKTTAAVSAKRVGVRAVNKAAVGVVSSSGAVVPAVVVAALVGVFVVVLGAGLVAWAGATSPNPLALEAAHTQAVASTGDIPLVVYSAYVNAASQAPTIQAGCVLRPAVIAGIGYVESGHGTSGGAVVDSHGDVAPPIIGVALDGSNGTASITDTDGGVWDSDTVWDRAVGPMQFIPASWEAFGRDANNDGTNDPHNIFDAALGAVGLLCRASPVDMNASADQLRNALFSYNHSSGYVDDVMARIGYYDLVFGGQRGTADVAGLLANPNFGVCAAARTDLETGVVDPRAVRLMSMIVQTHSILVCPLKSGHYQCVGGGSLASRPNCTESHHWYGRGIDIGVVDGTAVNSSNAGAYAIVDWLADLPAGDELRPTVGSPWPEFGALPGFFHDADHTDHLHLGFCGPRWSHGVLSDSCPAPARTAAPVSIVGELAVGGTQVVEVR